MNIIKYSSVLGASLLLPIITFAASITLSPTDVTSKVGQTFTLSISADPAGVKAFTTRANISFDPASVEFVSFSFAPKWIALSQTGYDSEDNVKGSLLKTAGYPGGLTSSTVLGTATFRAKVAGSSTISVTSDSLALGSGGKNLISGTQGSMNVTIAPLPVQQPAEPVVQTTSIPTPQKAITQTSVSTTTTVTAEATSTTISTSTSVAAVGATGSSSKNTTVVLIGVLLLAIISGLIWRYRRTRE